MYGMLNQLKKDKKFIFVSNFSKKRAGKVHDIILQLIASNIVVFDEAIPKIVWDDLSKDDLRLNWGHIMVDSEPELTYETASAWNGFNLMVE